jgi:hypothetical protein
MAYIGNDLQVAFPSYRIIDDISGSFNGVLKTFALRINGTAPVPFPINPQQCLISVNNVVQKPDPSGATGFNLVGTNIVFASAPTAGWAFFGTVLAGADYVNVGVSFPDGSVTAPSITFDADTNTGLYRQGEDQIGITCGGVNVGAFTSSGPTFQIDTNNIKDGAVTFPKLAGSALAATSDVNGVNTTGTITSGTASLTVASATGIVAGMFVVGQGITPGTTVSSIASTTVTLSANAGATLSSAPVTFYSASKVITPATVGGMLCRAWVNFNGTGTVAIRASYNVSSITDNGVGSYTVNFATALADANYCSQVSSNFGGASGWLEVGTTKTTSAVSVNTTTHVNFSGDGRTASDFSSVDVSIFR